MSLILEALRKSEAERRRGRVPDVAAELPPTRVTHAHRTPAWLWPALVVGTLALIAVLWWSLRDEPSPAPVAPVPQQTEAEAEVAPPALVVRPRPMPSVVAPPQTQPQTSQPAPEPASPAPVAIATPRSQPAQPAPAPFPPTHEDIPTTTASRTELTMHVWDESAARRFVILDGQRMGEGDRNGDLQVVSIERDGVVIERNGQRSRLRLP